MRAAWFYCLEKVEGWKNGTHPWWQMYLLNRHASKSDFTFVLAAFLIICIVRFFLSGVFHPRWRQYPNLFRALTWSVSKRRSRAKLCENLWYAVWHTSSLAFGLYTLYTESGTPSAPGWVRNVWRTGDAFWYWNPSPAEQALGDLGWPLHILNPTIKIYYLTECAYWLSCAAYLLFECRRDDFNAMVLHHLATCSLIIGSYCCSFWRIGIIILVCHDIADVALYTAKSLSYTKCPSFMIDIGFVVFALSFFFSRLVFLPIYCVLPVTDIKNVAKWSEGVLTGPQDIPGGYILPLLLVLLQLLHVFWFGLIIKMILRTLDGSRVSDRGDIRSDDETVTDETE